MEIQIFVDRIDTNSGEVIAREDFSGLGISRAIGAASDRNRALDKAYGHKNSHSVWITDGAFEYRVDPESERFVPNLDNAIRETH